MLCVFNKKGKNIYAVFVSYHNTIMASQP